MSILVSAAAYLQFLNHTVLNPQDCYPLAGAVVLLPLVEKYLRDEQLLKKVYEETVRTLAPMTVRAIRDTGSTITVKSGQMLMQACSPIVEKLNRSFHQLAKRVHCAVRPVLCSTLSSFADVISLKKWTITMKKAPPNSY